jgi:hypothetical protein
MDEMRLDASRVPDVFAGHHGIIARLLPMRQV